MVEHFYRVICYWSPFQMDGVEFSDCSTNFYVLGPVFIEKPNNKVLMDLIKEDEDQDVDETKLEFTEVENEHSRSLTIERYAYLRDQSTHSGDHKMYVGVICVRDEDGIEPLDTNDNEVTLEILEEVYQQGGMSIYDMGEDADGDLEIIKEGWDFYPLWKLHGYDIDESPEMENVTWDGFTDDTFKCDGCQTVLSDTYHSFRSNKMIPEDEYEQLGVTCGCWAKDCEDKIHHFLDNPEKALPSGTMDKLIEKGLVVHYADLCHGWSCCSTDPGDAIGKLYEKSENGEFDMIADEEDYTEGILFQVDSVGQFDTGFSMWIYRDRSQNTPDGMLQELTLAYEKTGWLKDGDSVVIVNSANPDTLELFKEWYPDHNTEGTLYSVAIMLKDGGLNEEFAMSEPMASEYLAMRQDLIELNVWDNIHDRRG